MFLFDFISFSSEFMRADIGGGWFMPMTRTLAGLFCYNQEDRTKSETSWRSRKYVDGGFWWLAYCYFHPSSNVT